MNTHTATLGIPEIARPGRYPLNLHLSFNVRWFIDKWLFLIEAILEYALMMHIGAAVGYVVGKCAGYIYAEHCQPDCSPELIIQVWLMPYRFAVYGAAIGACVGMIVRMALAIRQNIRNNNEKSLANDVFSNSSKDKSVRTPKPIIFTSKIQHHYCYKPSTKANFTRLVFQGAHADDSEDTVYPHQSSNISHDDKHLYDYCTLHNKPTPAASDLVSLLSNPPNVPEHDASGRLMNLYKNRRPHRSAKHKHNTS